ncbi:MAG: ferritin-like domain-containing protein [Myxococcota bacterium]|nr:ferritin-like domain-containing protein [Myxococcota bacterium]
MDSKFLNHTRRSVAGFELIDFADSEEISSMRETLSVDTPTHIRWNDWEYGSEVEELRSLYEKGKANQWNASKDLDWETPVSKDEWMGELDMSMLANLLKMMGKSEAEQKAAMFDEVAYTCSQLLHGEQAALQLCGQLTSLCPTTDEKLYAANQVADEARHIEIFARLTGEKMGTIYPIMPTLKFLLDELLVVEGYHMKTLGMQTLFEGMAVGIMGMMREQAFNPLLVKLLQRAEQDEARHAAFGVFTMRRVVERAEPEQRDQMEDWAFKVLEALNASQQLGMLHALGPKYGIDANQVTEGMLAMPEWNELNSQLYMHTVVPNLIRLGLITERTRDKWIACGMLVESQLSGKSVPLSN